MLALIFNLAALVPTQVVGSANGCHLNTSTNDFDFTETTRCSEYPNGISVNLSTCAELCCSTSDCTLFAWLSHPLTCWPLSSASNIIPNRDRNHYIGLNLPPQPTPMPPMPPPDSWAPKIASGDMLYAPEGDSQLPPERHPMVGNGFLATQIMSSSIYCAGVFNGGSPAAPANPVSHRARIPAVHAVSAPGRAGPAALDIRTATFFRRSFVPPGPCSNASTVSCTRSPTGLWVEQRWYAHRALPSILVMELEALIGYNSSSGSGEGESPAADDAPFAMLLIQNNPGGESADITFQSQPLPQGTPYTLQTGTTNIPETHNVSVFSLAVVATALPPSKMVSISGPGVTLPFIAAIRSSIETSEPGLSAAAEGDFAAASAAAAAGTLWASHVEAWESTVWSSGIELDRKDAAKAANSSLYSILSSMRPDRPFSSSPGGLAQDCYNGHSFWDDETWSSSIFPTLFFFLVDFVQRC